MGKIKKILLVFMLCTVLFAMSGCGGESYGEFTWPSTELGSIMPKPDMELVGEIERYSDDYLRIIVANVTSEGFSDYKELCASEGFDVSVSSSSSRYSAKDDLGYELTVSYDERDKTMSIKLSASGVYGEFTWPDSDIAKLLPVPESNYGYIDIDSSEYLIVYVAQTTEENYNEYVNLCKNVGFTVDYSASSGYYVADNENGYHLTLEYEDGNVMYIGVEAPEEPEETEAETEETDAEPEVTEQEEEEEEVTTAEPEEEEKEPEEEAEETSNGIRPEVKEALDSYEEFMDEYIEFMEKYEEDGSPVSMLAEYLDYISKYAETMEKLEALDDIEMNDAELAYYLEVTSRVTQKLLAAAE